jgi:hypothetical protein
MFTLSSAKISKGAMKPKQAKFIDVGALCNYLI